MEVIISKKFEITKQQMSDLLVCAFNGGINYWCDDVAIKKHGDASADAYASDVIGCGGKLILEVEGKDHTLTQDKMLKGIAMGMDWGNHATVDDLMDNHDAETTDVILQYALFDEIVYG